MTSRAADRTGTNLAEADAGSSLARDALARAAAGLAAPRRGPGCGTRALARSAAFRTGEPDDLVATAAYSFQWDLKGAFEIQAA